MHTYICVYIYIYIYTHTLITGWCLLEASAMRGTHRGVVDVSEETTLLCFCSTARSKFQCRASGQRLRSPGPKDPFRAHPELRSGVHKGGV